jgi:hypothetical protein
MIISSSSTLCTHAWGLLCGRGPYIPHTCGRVCGVLHGILWARICYTNAPVPPLVASVLRPQTSPSDSLRGPAYSSLCDSIQGLPRDWPWVRFVEVLIPCPAPQNLEAKLMIFGGHGYPCQIRAWSRSLPWNPHAQINEGVVEKVVLPKKWCFHSASCVHRWPPHSVTPIVSLYQL